MKNSFQYNSCTIYKIRMCHKAKIKRVLKTLPSVRKMYIYYRHYNRVISELYLKTLKNLDKENGFFNSIGKMCRKKLMKRNGMNNTESRCLILSWWCYKMKLLKITVAMVSKASYKKIYGKER